MEKAYHAFARFESCPKELRDAVFNASQAVTLPKGQEILREGQYVKVIPIVLSGSLKVFTRHEDKDLFLYHIQSGESCIMSFTAGLKGRVSQVYASVEEDCEVMLLPSEAAISLVSTHPQIMSFFMDLHHYRYTDLLDTIHQVLFFNVDQRLEEFIKAKAKVTQSNTLNLSHRQIASELGTAREVISRVMKKLENQGKVKQHRSFIEILSM